MSAGSGRPCDTRPYRRDRTPDRPGTTPGWPALVLAPRTDPAAHGEPGADRAAWCATSSPILPSLVKHRTRCAPNAATWPSWPSTMQAASTRSRPACSRRSARTCAVARSGAANPLIRSIGRESGGLRVMGEGVSGNDRYLESGRCCLSCRARRVELPGFAWWTWLSAVVHHVNLSEERCKFSGCCRPSHGVSRGRCSGTTAR